MVWAMATLDFNDPKMMRMLASEAQRQLHKFNAQELSNLAIAYGRVLHYDAGEQSAAFSLISGRHCCHVKSLEIPQAALLCRAPHTWSPCQVFCFQCPANSHRRDVFAELMNSLAEECCTRLHEFTTQGVANIGWSFATLRHYSPKLLNAVTKNVSQKETSHLESLATAPSTHSRSAAVSPTYVWYVLRTVSW